MESSSKLRLWFSENSELMFRLKGTVILKIWPQVLFGILFSILVVSCHYYVPGMEMDFPLTLVPILGVVISLLLVFRTNTAYDRYYEGRRIWSTMTQAIRIQTRCFWLGVKDHTGTSKDIIEKTTAINLLVAFAFATKNYLREEYSYEADEEIRELISHVPKFQTPETQNQSNTKSKQSNNTRNGSQVTIEIDIDDLNDENKMEQQNKSKNKEIIGKSLHKTMSARRRSADRVRQSVKGKESFTRRDFMFMAHDYIKPTNIPLQLAYYIDSYTYQFMARGSVDGDTFKVMLAATSNLMDSLTQFERILRTPIPLAYSVHLHHSVWLYLMSLPFQLVGTLGWITVPAIGLVTFALQGILAIGWEIENPFGYDDNDLPLDDFCDVIRKEAEMVMSHKIPTTESWTFTDENRPFSPKSFESALQLNEKSVEELRSILCSRNSEYSFLNMAFES